MGTKRPSSDSCASIRDTRNGTLYEVKNNEEFIIGRAQNSSIIIQSRLYISRKQSTISYENDQFVIYDNASRRSGTYLNYTKLSDEKVILKNGDIIAYTDQTKIWDLVYIFNVSSNSNKKPRVDEEECTAAEEGNNTSNEENKELIIKNQDQNLDLTKMYELKCDEENIIQKSVFEKMLNSVTECLSNHNKEMMKQQGTVQELNTNMAVYLKKYNVQKKLLDAKIEQQNHLAQAQDSAFKAKVHDLLKTVLHCPVCYEVMIKASVTNCSHTFCQSCIRKYMLCNTILAEKICPVCQSPVNSITYCLVLDNFITNLYDVLGGAIKVQRAALQLKRSRELLAPFCKW